MDITCPPDGSVVPANTLNLQVTAYVPAPVPPTPPKKVPVVPVKPPAPPPIKPAPIKPVPVKPAVPVKAGR
jgi:hypothetical protein